MKRLERVVNVVTRKWFTPSVDSQVAWRYHTNAMADVRCSCGMAYPLVDLLRKDNSLVQICRWFLPPDPQHWAYMPTIVSYSQYRHLVDRGITG